MKHFVNPQDLPTIVWEPLSYTLPPHRADLDNSQINNHLPNSMKQKPSWEGNSHSASQIPCLLWNPMVHYHVHKSLPWIPTPCQMYPVHTFPSYFPKIQCTIILPSMPRSSKWSFPSGFLATILYTVLTSPMHATCPSHLILIWSPK